MASNTVLEHNRLAPSPYRAYTLMGRASKNKCHKHEEVAHPVCWDRPSLPWVCKRNWKHCSKCKITWGEQVPLYLKIDGTRASSQKNNLETGASAEVLKKTCLDW